MSNTNVTVSGKLDFEYNEDGSKTSEVVIKNSKGNKLYLGIKVRYYFNSSITVIESIGVFTSKNTKFFKTKEESMEYIYKLLEEKGFEVKRENILNFDI
jgi:hypothetical protein